MVDSNPQAKPEESSETEPNLSYEAEIECFHDAIEVFYVSFFERMLPRLDYALLPQLLEIWVSSGVLLSVLRLFVNADTCFILLDLFYLIGLLITFYNSWFIVYRSMVLLVDCLCAYSSL